MTLSTFAFRKLNLIRVLEFRLNSSQGSERLPESKTESDCAAADTGSKTSANAKSFNRLFIFATVTVVSIETQVALSLARMVATTNEDSMKNRQDLLNG
jgi:hypothetical protein